jgi:zinc D-Ala-D-Ala carboxypeptidase
VLVSVLTGAGLALAAPAAVPAVASSAPAAATADAKAADGCYTWSGTLSEGASGEAVRQLQIRVAGYPGSGSQLAIDGQFGPGTKAAVQRFQSAYGLGADGVAGAQTFNKIYELQDDDCSPVNFTYDELNNCNSDWSGGKVSAATARANALVTMWKLQAMRHAMGDKPITVNGGFRSVACNSAVGGAANSRHLYGHAADLGAGSQGFCALALAARNHGFTEILGPGYPGHDDHTHVAGGDGRFWSAPSCGM